MGLINWMASKGAVGGTARWAAQGYKLLSAKDLGIRGPKLYKSLIRTRFMASPNDRHETFLLSIAEEIVGLRGLVVAILTFEAGFTENTPENQRMFLDVIDEELIKNGVPRDIVFNQ